MWRYWLLAMLLGCGPGTVSTDRGLHTKPPAASRCERIERTVTVEKYVGGQLVQQPGERASWIGCMASDGVLDYGVVVLDGLKPELPLGTRLVGTLEREGGGPAGPGAEAPSTLSGTAATEQRLPYYTFGPELRVLRYVQRGDTLYYAYVMGRASVMAEKEAENAAWLDAVRIDDLAASP